MFRIQLTNREEQIAELLAWGASKKEVPDLLMTKPGKRPIAIRTVENTVRNIYEKLGIQKVNELSAWYFCTHFHISFNLSPLQKRLIAVLLFISIAPSEIITLKDAIRPRITIRNQRIAELYPQRRREDTFTLELI